MKLICRLFFILSSAMVFAADPWHLNPEQYALLKGKIEERHQELVARCRSEGIDYFADLCELKLSSLTPSCSYCLSAEKCFDPALEQKLHLAGFQKIEAEAKITGHCFGSSIIFLKHLFDQEPYNWGSCTDILSAISNDPNFVSKAHLFSVNQPSYYHKLPVCPAAGKYGSCMYFHPNAVKEFLSIIVGKAVEHYFFIPAPQADPSKFDSATIYATLEKLPN